MLTTAVADCGAGDGVGQGKDLRSGQEDHLVLAGAADPHSIAGVLPDGIGADRFIEDHGQHPASVGDGAGTSAGTAHLGDEAGHVGAGDGVDTGSAEDG